MKLISFLLTMVIASAAIHATKLTSSSNRPVVLDVVVSAPRSCNTELVPFQGNRMEKVISQVVTAFDYYMKSTDPAAGRTYEERTANFQAEAKRTYAKFGRVRIKDYEVVVCEYYGEDWNKPGDASNAHIQAAPGFYLLQETLEHTTNGDWKGGPTHNGDFTTMTWRTGGHGSSKTFAKIMRGISGVHSHAS